MIKQIANYYGFDCQSRQLVEEMAELTIALNKLNRTGKMINEYNAVVEELADVEVMLEQIKYLMSCNVEVDDIKKKKINRQLKRMKKEKLEKTGIK